MRLPYDEAGSGPVIVLLHAGVADRTMWREHLEPLAAAGYRVIALDLPGFGEAHVPPGAQAPWNDVLETMNVLGVERAALVGNSFGGAVALRVAAVAPVAASALALISTPPPDLEPSPELQAAWEAEEAALERGEAAVQAVVDAWTLPDAPAELRERRRRDAARARSRSKRGPDAPEAPIRSTRTGPLARLDVRLSSPPGARALQRLPRGRGDLGAQPAQARLGADPGGRPSRAAGDAGGVPGAAARVPGADVG